MSERSGGDKQVQRGHSCNCAVVEGSDTSGRAAGSMGRAPPRFLSIRLFGLSLPEQIAVLAPAAPAELKIESPQAEKPRPAGLWRGGANRDYCVRQLPANVSPGAPGQKRIARTSPFPEIRTAGQQRAISKARCGLVTGDSAFRLGRQAATPFGRQRTSGHQSELREAVAIRAVARVARCF